MSEQTPAVVSVCGADLHPEIRHFVITLNQAFADYPDFNNLPLPEMRRACEHIRAPWAAGGPFMALRQEHTVPTPVGEVRVRIHNPSARANKPALIYMHGGGWTTFSIDTHDRLMREYAARADAMVTTSFYEGASHSFLEAMSISAISNRAIDDTARWLRRR